MLKNFDAFILNNPDFIKKPNEFKFAILMHDYINGSPNEVHESAEAAEKFIKHMTLDYNVSYIKNLILATDYSHKTFKPSIDEQLIQDLDLLILGSNPIDYKEYAKLIRKQYAYIPDEIFNKEREKVLKSFLDKENIYNIDYFKTKYEVQARKNICNELEAIK